VLYGLDFLQADLSFGSKAGFEYVNTMAEPKTIPTGKSVTEILSLHK